MGQRFRDRPAGQFAAVAELLVRVSQFVVDFPEIAGLDARTAVRRRRGRDGGGCLDRLRRTARRPGRLAITPYPAELIVSLARRGEAMTLRPIRPEDAARTGVFHRLSPEDVRFRFFSAIRELSPEQVARLTQVDYDREMAFVAVREIDRRDRGVSRLVSSRMVAPVEFAVMVQPDMKGRGLAQPADGAADRLGRSRGLAEIVGQVLSDNAPMLAFVRRLGFIVRRMPEDPEVMEARLVLAEHPADAPGS